MNPFARPNRRTALASFSAASLALTAAARAQSSLDATEFGVAADSNTDQTAAMQQALDQAHISGQTLILPPGAIMVADLTFPPIITIQGSGIGSAFYSTGTKRIGIIAGANHAAFTNIMFDGAGITDAAGILQVQGSDDVSFDRCRFSAGTTGLQITDSAVSITDCIFGDHDNAAIHALDSRGLIITNNRIAVCGNAGIRIWRTEQGSDGSIVTSNHIETVDWRDGDNGQNGHGINIVRANDVLVANNHIAKCAFSAIRLNSARDTQISSNICLESLNCAIFAEGDFSGSIIANNLIDNAAAGISIGNFAQGGHLAVCAGNMVRNIFKESPIGLPTTPFGIFAEADVAISGNTVSGVPGPAIVAGTGANLRNVLIANNVVTEADYGIAVSVADGAGAVQIGPNMLVAREHDVVGMSGSDLVEPDLVANAARFPNVTIN